MKRSKYMAEKTEVNGITFASKKEAKRYKELLILSKAGEVEALQLQPTFVLQESFRLGKKKHSPVKYIADFSYKDKKTKKIIVEDVKGIKTPVYNIKKKLFLSKYGDKINFEEI